MPNVPHLESTDTTRHLHLRGALGKVTRKKFRGRDTLVIPVIALVEGVVHAMNATDAEFVPESTLKAAAETWNGRPLVLMHPVVKGKAVSANHPEVMESSSFGTIFNSRVKNKKLLMDAYVDVEHAETVGGKDFLTALEDNTTPIEVSVGSLVAVLEEEGTYNKKKYKGRWAAAVGDHLAFLPGKRGACSVEMGCGAHRAAGEAPIVYNVEELEMATQTRSLKERFKALVAALQNPETPKDELDALTVYTEDEPVNESFLTVLSSKDSIEERLEAVNVAVRKQLRNPLDPNSYVYASRTYDDYVVVYKDGKYFSVDYSMAKDGTVELDVSTTKEVKRKETFVAAEETNELRAAGCGCHNKETRMKIDPARVAALIANPHNPVKDQKYLESLDEAGFAALETNAASIKTLSEKAATDAAALKTLQEENTTLGTKVATLEANAIPAEELETMRALVAKNKLIDAAKKTTLVSTLKVAAAHVYTEEQLNAMDLVALENVAKLVKVDAPVSYAGQGIPVPAIRLAEDRKQFAPPDPYKIGAAATK